MELLTHAEEAAEADDGKQDRVVDLVENDVFDFADLVACGVLDAGADGAAGPDGRGVSGLGRHENAPMHVFQMQRERPRAAGVPVNSVSGAGARTLPMSARPC